MSSLHAHVVGSMQSFAYCTLYEHDCRSAHTIAMITIEIQGFAYDVVVVTVVVWSEAVMACNNTRRLSRSPRCGQVRRSVCFREHFEVAWR